MRNRSALDPSSASSNGPDAKGEDSVFDADSPTQSPPRPIILDDGSEEFLL